MPAVGGIARFGLPPAGRDQRGGLHDHSADRSAVPGAAVLRLAADGSVAGDPRSCRQPQTGPAPDAARRLGGDLPTAEHEQAGGSPQDLPLPGRDHGLGEPCRAGVAAVEHARCGVLCRGPRRSVLPVRPSRDLQHRPEPAPAKAGGSQFTSDDFTGTLQRHGVTISMDGKGRYMDNIFVERLWRSLKYEEVYLNAYASVAEAKAGIGSWLGFYNEERQHQSLGYRTPRQAYEAECPWICGRSASPTGCAFAHIPTGATANHRIDIDAAERSSAMTVAPGAIGAGTEIGRVTP